MVEEEAARGGSGQLERQRQHECSGGDQRGEHMNRRLRPERPGRVVHHRLLVPTTRLMLLGNECFSAVGTTGSDSYLSREQIQLEHSMNTVLVWRHTFTG